MKRRLVLFAKPPRSGEAKTRLAADIGPEAASLVARALLADTLALCEAVAAGAEGPPPELVLAYTDDRAYFEARVSDAWQLLPQDGADLGERLQNALAALDPAPEDATVFIGMDAPHLPTEYLGRAFHALAESGTVLGPCEDGGYYLVGVRGVWPGGVLAGVRWSTPHALADTRAAFEKAGLTCATLPGWYDVDDSRSLRRLARDLDAMPPDALSHLRKTLLLGADS
ncbi:MAG: TIGR04282 family arsenosugar biosynthesis glycosyltransferase [Armatimonadota bacterium]|jgi:rSAM/selenodomain-associated transferase 1